MANGLRVILDRLTNDTAVEWRIRIQIAVVDVVEVRSSYQLMEAGCCRVDLVSITSFFDDDFSIGMF